MAFDGRISDETAAPVEASFRWLASAAPEIWVKRAVN